MMLKRLLPIALVLTACASQREVAVLSTPAEQPVVAAVEPAGSYEYLTMVQGQTVTGTMSITGTNGVYSGRILSDAFPEIPITGATVQGQQMIVRGNMQGDELVLDLAFQGTNFTGTWALGADGGTITGKKLGAYKVIALDSKSTASMRGLDVVDANVVWASGTGGTVLRSMDGGATWEPKNVPGADSLDFRDLEAFDSLVAYVLSAGEDGRIYRTSDGGRTWNLQFRNTTKGAFFDCMDFWDARNGIAMSDPVDGRYLLLRTSDGVNWSELPHESRPVANEGEAAFAASGTCLVAVGGTHAYLSSGGGAQNARVFMTADRGTSWTPVNTPVSAGVGAAGIFSLAFRDPNTAIAAGGNYETPNVAGVVARTSNGGKTWEAVGSTEYVSGAAFVPGTSTVVVVGTSGTRISHDNGATWVKVDAVEYNAVKFTSAGVGFAVGARGWVARISER